MKLLSQLDPARKTVTVHSEDSKNGFDGRPKGAGKRPWKRAAMGTAVTLIATVLCAGCMAQSALPFEVSNPKHQKLPVDEAGKIYISACALAARAIRPERPPHLRPKFTLVLGAADDQMVREEAGSEIHLKVWNPANFAQAVVMLAAREILKNEDVEEIVRTAVISARASVSVSDLRHGR
jgi:hypothetical protein